MMRRSVLLIALSVISLQVACDDDPSETSDAGSNGGMTPGGMTPGGMTPGGMTPGGMTPGGMTPGGVDTGGMTPGGVDTGGMNMGGMVTGGAEGGGTPPPGVPLGSFVNEAAIATCDALYRCCDQQNVIDFFTPLSGNPRYEEIADLIPPNVEVDADSCPALMNTIFDVAPLGSWVRSVERNLVTYDGEAAERCLETMRNASCGDEVVEALYDGTCLSYSAPLGGDQQRQMFSRTRGVGETCGPIYDGVGGVFYGACDPNVAFCCARNDQGDCLPGSNELVVGECVAVSAVGEACSAFPAQLCATGSECSVDGVCEGARTDPLSVGDLCTENFSPLGDCVDSFCDFGGSDRCEAYLPLGAECGFGYECQTGSCQQGTCQEQTFCQGG